jgi:hypothetical protein
MQPAGAHADIAQIRNRAAEQAALARQIAEAMRVRDVVHARLLIEEGAARFGHTAMLAAVELQASQERMQAMEPVRESYRGVDDQWPDDRYERDEEW